MSYRVNNFKNAVHGFFLSLAITIAEPSTILPLIVNHFSSSLPLVGLFASLLRGGAIAVQLFAAFYAQSFERVLPYLRIVFAFRFLSWFMVGLAIYAIGEPRPVLTLWLIGTGLFFFSFSAGFGGIYFKELMAKIFSREERGRTMANRQLFSSLGAILSGGIAGAVLQHYPAPESYAYLFMLSSLVMLPGFILFATIEEPRKRSVNKREDSFSLFLKNASEILKRDKILQLEIAASLLAYSYLLALPFVILRAKESMALSGWLVGGFITIQMTGSVLGNFFLWKRFGHGYTAMLKSSFVIIFLSIVTALFASDAWSYSVIFLLFGIGIDGFRNADMNLIIEIAPERKRPVYVAIQSTIVSVGLFFPILGGFILKYGGYGFLYLFTLVLLCCGFVVTGRLEKRLKGFSL